MASVRDGGIGEAEATAAANCRRTIYDYLGEGEDGGTASPPAPETPPRLRLPRFTCARIRFGRLGRKRGGRSGQKEAEKSEDASVDSSGWNQAAEGRDSGRGGGGVSAGHTGMGLSMLLLLARTCVELNRMAEVRAQMEALLKEIRDEASRVKSAADHGVVVVAPKPCHDLQSSSTTTASSSCVSDTSTTNCVEPGRGEDGKRAASEDEGCAGSGTDVLELEGVEAGRPEREPASQRQPPPECKFDTDTKQETPECSVQSSSDDDDEFIELAGGRFGTGGSSHSDRGVAVDDESDGGGSCELPRDEGGVSAAELERRLHELRHRRDRERIEALEAALRRAQRKLTEKEMEARLWQDTAALALGRPAPRDGLGQ